MIKLSELKDDVKVIDENSNVYDVEDVKNDLIEFKGKNLFTTIEYVAELNARRMLDDIIELESQSMYEDWDERISSDVTDKDIEKLQDILDDILSRNKSQNIAYIQDEEIEVDYE